MSIFSTSYIFIHENKASKESVFLGRTVNAGAEKVRQAGCRYAVGLEDEVGPLRTFEGAKDRAKILVQRYPNHKVVMRSFKNAHRVDQVRFVTLSKKPPVANTPGVEGIDRIVGWLESEVKQGRLTSRRYAGICVCKHTASGGHSDHADCAAIDIFATDHDMEVIRDTVIDEAEYFHTKYDILYNRIWFPGPVSEPYTGEWHAHVHISVTGGVYNSAC